MFDASTYTQRRQELAQKLKSGLAVFLGHKECPMNFADNPFPFRQDSSFLYFFGLDKPGLAAIIDIDQSKTTLYGDNLGIEDIVWMGPQPLLQDQCAEVGINHVAPAKKLAATLQKARQKGKPIHFLPQYRTENALQLSEIQEVPYAEINAHASEDLIRAVVALREIKSDAEVQQIEIALEITYDMHTFALHRTRPGTYEREIAGGMEGIALAHGGHMAFPVIFTINGHILHNHCHSNRMQAGDIVINDSGAAAPSHYAGDITRTLPVGSHFSDQQREIYDIVFEAQTKAIEAMRPGVAFKEVHLLAARAIVSGLKSVGLMKGNVDEAVAAGAQALFFPHGLGHMMGLDVHDMESLGEDFVGYDTTVRRSKQFGLRSLRLAKKLHPGFVVTVEPGIYFIPELIEQWKAQKKLTDFIDYHALAAYRHFGGIRIEDDVLVTESGHRVLGKRIPKKVEGIEALASI